MWAMMGGLSVWDNSGNGDLTMTNKCCICYKVDRDCSHVEIGNREICTDCAESDIGQNLINRERMKERVENRQRKYMIVGK